MILFRLPYPVFIDKTLSTFVERIFTLVLQRGFARSAACFAA